MSAEPPVFEERRQNPDRRQGGRRAEDRTQFLRNAAAAAVAICGGLVIIYLFFGAIGAVDFTVAGAASVVAIVMAAVWLSGYWWRQRAVAAEGGRPHGNEDRERRGF